MFTGELRCTLLHLVENEWVGWLYNWDIETVGQRLTVRRERRGIPLQLRLDPSGRIVVKCLDMRRRLKQGGIHSITAADRVLDPIILTLWSNA